MSDQEILDQKRMEAVLKGLGWRGVVRGGSRMVCVALAAMAVGLALAGGAGAATTYLSCGWPPIYDSYSGETLDGHITYKRHPHRCYYSEDGSTAGLVNLVDIRWKHWGERRAFARAKRVDNHDMDRNGFQRHPVRVILSYRKGAVGHSGKSKLYYTRMRVFDQGSTGVLNLFRPGQPAVALRVR